MNQKLAYWPAGTPKCDLWRTADGTYEAEWIGRADLARRDGRVGCQQFVDVVQPIGRQAPIGIVGHVLAEDDVPFDWNAYLLPLVHAESFPEAPDFADPERIRENREFIRYACQPGSQLACNYSATGAQPWYGFASPFLVSEHGRKEEILGILDFLDGKRPLFVKDALFTALQEAMWGMHAFIASRNGYAEWFERTFRELAQEFLETPRELTVKEFLRTRVDADRLIERDSSEHAELGLPIEHDVFLSHFHGDHAAADAILAAIHELNPSARVFRTEATEAQQRRFEENPFVFLEAARRSACLVYLATPNSLGRVFVRQELGNNALRPILTLLVGISLQEFEQQRLREMYVAYQSERIFELDRPPEWGRFLADLRALREWPTASDPQMPDLTPGAPSERTKQEEGDSFLAWSERTRRGG